MLEIQQYYYNLMHCICYYDTAVAVIPYVLIVTIRSKAHINNSG